VVVAERAAAAPVLAVLAVMVVVEMQIQLQPLQGMVPMEKAAAAGQRDLVPQVLAVVEL
jgi:hypothetical protein